MAASVTMVVAAVAISLGGNPASGAFELDENLGVVAPAGECVFVWMIEGTSSVRTPEQAVAAQLLPAESLTKTIVDPRTVVFHKLEGDRRDVAYLATRHAHGAWFVSKRAVAHPCDRASDPVVHNPRNVGS